MIFGNITTDNRIVTENCKYGGSKPIRLKASGNKKDACQYGGDQDAPADCLEAIGQEKGLIHCCELSVMSGQFRVSSVELGISI